MVTLRLGHSIFAVIFLIGSLMCAALSGVVALEMRSLVAALFCALFGLIAARLGWVLLRRQKKGPGEVVVMGGIAGSAVTPDAFMTFARHSKGAWSQQGVVMIADHGGIFLPMGRPAHLLVSFALTAFASQVRFADVSFLVGGTTPQAMADAARRHKGIVLGPDWHWNGSMRWLHRAPSDGVLVLDHAPADRMGVFRPAAKPTQAELRHGARLAVLFGGVGSALLLAIGAAGAYWQSDLEILLGFAAYAVMLIVAVVIGVVVAKRRFA